MGTREDEATGLRAFVHDLLEVGKQLWCALCFVKNSTLIIGGQKTTGIFEGKISDVWIFQTHIGQVGKNGSDKCGFA